MEKRKNDTPDGRDPKRPRITLSIRGNGDSPNNNNTEIVQINDQVAESADELIDLLLLENDMSYYASFANGKRNPAEILRLIPKNINFNGAASGFYGERFYIQFPTMEDRDSFLAIYASQPLLGEVMTDAPIDERNLSAFKFAVIKHVQGIILDETIKSSYQGLHVEFIKRYDDEFRPGRENIVIGFQAGTDDHQIAPVNGCFIPNQDGTRFQVDLQHPRALTLWMGPLPLNFRNILKPAIVKSFLMKKLKIELVRVYAPINERFIFNEFIEIHFRNRSDKERFANFKMEAKGVIFSLLDLSEISSYIRNKRKDDSE